MRENSQASSLPGLSLLSSCSARIIEERGSDVLVVGDQDPSTVETFAALMYTAATQRPDKPDPIINWDIKVSGWQIVAVKTYCFADKNGCLCVRDQIFRPLRKIIEFECEEGDDKRFNSYVITPATAQNLHGPVFRKELL